MHMRMLNITLKCKKKQSKLICFLLDRKNVQGKNGNLLNPVIFPIIKEKTNSDIYLFL